MWGCTSTQSKALDAVLLRECKKILSCSSKTCNEAVWGDLGVEPLAFRRAKSKVVWYSKLLGKDKNSYCSDFHLMSAFENTRYIFDQSIWECNGHFDHWFSNIKSFLCSVWKIFR